MAGAGRRIGFSFDGRELFAAPGSTIASALLANGVRSWRRSRATGQPRGLLCGIGTCFDCLVDVGEERAVRACLRLLCDGDAVATSASVGGPGEPWTAPSPGAAIDDVPGAVDGRP
jgi:predicted molibdopterin-dependent oxidoreductase YjgC